MSHIKDERNIILLSEVGHIQTFERYLKEHPSIVREGYTLIPLDREIEYILTERNVEFLSGKTYRSPDADYMILAESYASALFANDRWNFFTYRGVSLGHVYTFQLHTYLSRPLYYTDILSTIIKRHETFRRLIVFPPITGGPVRGSTLVNQKIQSLADTARCIGEQCNITVEIPEITVPLIHSYNSTLFNAKRTLFSISISFVNVVVGLLQRPRSIRILASDYWKNLEPFLKQLPEAELVLIDRKEAFNAGWRNIWNFRMRFLHTDAFKGESTKRVKAQETFAREWKSIVSHNALPPLEFRGFSLVPLVARTLDIMMRHVIKHNLKEIDDTHAMLRYLKPHAVLVRSTVSTQTHFVILAESAHMQGIPSIEMQHGIEYYGPASSAKRHRTEFTGVYGPLTKKQLEEVGDTSTAVIIGSPRFDVYASLNERNRNAPQAKKEGISILCIAPAVDTGYDADTYDIEDYFRAMAEAMRVIPHTHLTVKFRPGPNGDSFVYKILARFFADIPHTIAQFESLADLYPKADIVVSTYSTAVLEALQCGKPLVFLGLSPMYQMVGKQHFPLYLAQNVMRIAASTEELARTLHSLATDPTERASISKSAMAFLKEAYAFDGKAGERTAAFIRSLVPHSAHR